MRVTVLTGGTSSERDVALASAVQVVAALRRIGHRVAVVDTARGYVPEHDEPRMLAGSVGVEPPSIEHLRDLERGVLLSGLASIPAVRDADVLFLCLHGGRGEDGSIQTLLEMVGVPYTGSGRLGSGIAMDKDLSKRLFRLAGVPTADWVMAPAARDDVVRDFGLPVVVKPSKQGSTVGLSVVKQPGEYDAAVELAARYDDEVMIERFVPGRELTVGILDGEALAVGEIIPKHEIFDYECKYTPGMSQEIFPADLTPDLTAEVRRLGLLAHEALKLGGYSRVDFRLTPEGRLFCLEVNTLPGMTATSLLPQSAAAVGIEFAELCDRICRSARPHGHPDSLRRSDSNGTDSGPTAS
jgi:D-alanine-D-alanine ligase